MDLLPRYSDETLYKYLTPVERAFVIENTYAETILPGELFSHPADERESMYVIEQGALEVIDPRFDTETVVSTLHAGEVLWEVAFFTQMPRTSVIRARERSVLRAFNQEVLRFLAAGAPEILGKISLSLCEILSGRLQETFVTLPTLMNRLSNAHAKIHIAGIEESTALQEAARELHAVNEQLRYL